MNNLTALYNDDRVLAQSYFIVHILIMLGRDSSINQMNLGSVLICWPSFNAGLSEKNIEEIN